MKNNTPKEILDKIKSSKRIFMSLHTGPDGDSLASCCAMKYFLEKNLKKKVELISPDTIGEAFQLFDFYKEVKFGKKYEDYNLDEFDLFLFLDHGNIVYYGKPLEIPKEKIINIDHHHTNTYFGCLNYVDSSRPSACSVLADLFREWSFELTPKISTMLLLGLYTDSLEFTTSKSAFDDAHVLINNGADYLKIVDAIKYHVPLKLKKYFALATENFRIEKINNYNVGISSISINDLEKLGLSSSDARLAPNYLQDIAEIDFLFVLSEMKDNIKGSFRSRKKVDTSFFAKELGGGGHKFACAFRLEKMSLKEAEKKVIDVIKKIGIHIVKD